MGHPITANMVNAIAKIIMLVSNPSRDARGHNGMHCMRDAAQNQAVGHITVILGFSLKHLTHLSSPTYVLTTDVCADNSAI